MSKVSVAWNKDQTRSVVLSKLKEFSVDEGICKGTFTVKGWFNKESAFSFGAFDTEIEAKLFLQRIHDMYN
jgi:hypothetical protein